MSILTTFAFLDADPTSAAIADEISQRQKQIEELQRQIEEYQTQIDLTRGKSRTLQNEISLLNAKIGQLNLEIRSLELSISKTSSEIKTTSEKIEDAEEKLKRYQDALARYIQLIHEQDRVNLTSILIKQETLSDFFNNLNSIESTQRGLKVTIDDIKYIKSDLEIQQEDLEEKRTELEQLRRLQELEKRSLDGTKSNKNSILKQTKGQESKFQELIKKSARDIEAIRSQIFYLQQNGVSAEDAVKFGQLAALRAGIRPAYLIAVLEVESGLGRNVGRCNRESDPPEKHWQVIMHTRDHAAFLSITASLGLNSENTPVSCPQYVNGKKYGWGGAMGPAQFIPSTWMGYKDQVAALTGRAPANPWNIEDAFLAAALKLARAGATAQTRTAEVAASKAYYSGNSKCSTSSCNSYANAIQRKAADIADNL